MYRSETRLRFVLIAALMWVASRGTTQADVLDDQVRIDDQMTFARGFLNTYCIDCHNTRDAGGERDFESLTLSRSHEDTLIELRDIVDQLTLGEMPPIDVEQPEESERRKAIKVMRSIIAAVQSQLQSTGGQTVLRRLNRREYLATIGDLFELEMTMFDPTTAFPEDATVEHLDNIGDALVTSSFLLEQHLGAAEKIIDKVFAQDQDVREQNWTFDGGFNQQPELRGAHKLAFESRFMCLYDGPLADKPEGAYGHLPKFEQGVPVDGIYEIRVLARALHRDTPFSEKVLRMELDEPFRLGIRPGNIDVGELHVKQPIQPLLAEAVVPDARLDESPKWITFRVPLDAGMTPRLTFENGHSDSRGAYSRLFRERKYRETFPKHTRGSKGIVQYRNTVLKFGAYPQIRIHKVEVRGPIDHQRPNVSMKRVLGPVESLERLTRTNVRATLHRFASLAYRRPVTKVELGNLMRLFDSRLKSGRSIEVAFQDSLKMMLCSPGFLYHEPIRKPNGPLSQTAFATRLSYFLTGTMPDETLRNLAERKELSDPETIREQTRRLLDSESSDAFVRQFLDGWLNLRALGDMPPDRNDFREYYTRNLREDMREETFAMFRKLIDDNGSIIDLLSSDYTFLNRDLAKLYGIEDRVPADDRSHRFRRVSLPNSRRGGLLGHASVLTVTANGIETSPILRGVWLLENILGTPSAPPPDDVPTIDPDVRGAKSIRDLIEKHRSSPACAECHRKIDPLGFALESYDAIGRWRTRYENKAPIDPSGVMPSGQEFDDVVGLKKVLLARKDFFATMLTEKLMAYGLGRRLEPMDMATVDRITESLKQDGYPLASLIEKIATCELFSR